MIHAEWAGTEQEIESLAFCGSWCWTFPIELHITGPPRPHMFCVVGTTSYIQHNMISNLHPHIVESSNVRPHSVEGTCIIVTTMNYVLQASTSWLKTAATVYFYFKEHQPLLYSLTQSTWVSCPCVPYSEVTRSLLVLKHQWWMTKGQSTISLCQTSAGSVGALMDVVALVLTTAVGNCGKHPFFISPYTCR